MSSNKHRKVDNPDLVYEEIIEMRYKQFKTTNTIVQFLKKKYGLKDSRAYNYVRDARTKMGQQYNETNASVLEDAIHRMETMLENAIEAGKNKLALDIQKELNRILELSKQEVKLDLEKITIVINKE